MTVLTVTDKDFLRNLITGKDEEGIEFRGGIVAYVSGFEQGSNGLSGITGAISIHLYKKYGIGGEGHETWDQQLEILANKRRKTWETVFAEVVKEIL